MGGCHQQSRHRVIQINNQPVSIVAAVARPQFQAAVGRPDDGQGLDIILSHHILSRRRMEPAVIDIV